MSTIPETWQPKPHYEVGITWFIRKPNEREVMGEEFAAEESKEFSGWHFFLRTNEDLLYDRLEDAIGKIKTTLKHWRMQNPFEIERVPIQVSKKSASRWWSSYWSIPLPILMTKAKFFGLSGSLASTCWLSRSGMCLSQRNSSQP